MARSWSKRSRMPPLTMSLRWMTPRTLLSRATTSGVPPELEMRSTISCRSAGTVPPCSFTQFITASPAPLRICVPSISTPLMRVCAVKGMNSASWSCSSRPRRPYFSFASTTMLRPSGVSSAREESCAASASSFAATPCSGMNSAAWRLPSVMVPGLVQQQRVHVARRLHRLAGHRQHVVLHHPVHPGDADGGEQAADGGRDQADQQRHQHRDARQLRPSPPSGRRRPRRARASTTARGR